MVTKKDTSFRHQNTTGMDPELLFFLSVHVYSVNVVRICPYSIGHISFIYIFGLPLIFIFSYNGP
uniref:Uncharacterized protein n=1 Tax=Babesia bovis TaxID=5865 RepID=S6BPA2_BABBO|nr:hypothetical protein [Babesia bovis]